MGEKGKISLVTYILSLIVIAIIVIAAIVVVFNKKENNENTTSSIVSQSETNSELIEDIAYIEISVEDETNTEDRYAKYLKVEDQTYLKEIKNIVNNGEIWVNAEKELGVGGFFEGCPIVTVCSSNGKKTHLLACDGIKDDINVFAVWYKDDASDKTLYKTKKDFETYINRVYYLTSLSNKETNTEITASQIDWEEYPKDIDEKVNEWIGEIDLSNEVGKVSYNLMKKTIYSLSQQKEDTFNRMYFNGDSTEIIEKNSNYSRYCYPDNENNDLSAKYTRKIEYQMAVFNELYYDGYYDLETLVKRQHETLVQKKDYKHYTNVSKNLYYEINKVLIMNGNNESENEYKNNGRAKKIKLTINKEKEYTFDLKDTNKVQIFDIDYRQNTIETPVNIEIEVLDKYNGEKTNDIYISDIQFGITSNIPQGR